MLPLTVAVELTLKPAPLVTNSSRRQDHNRDIRLSASIEARTSIRVHRQRSNRQSDRRTGGERKSEGETEKVVMEDFCNCCRGGYMAESEAARCINEQRTHGA